MECRTAQTFNHKLTDGESYGMNVGQNRRGNLEWTIQRDWQHWAHKTLDEDKQNTKTQHNTEN